MERGRDAILTPRRRLTAGTSQTNASMNNREHTRTPAALDAIVRDAGAGLQHEGHAAKVPPLIADLERRTEFAPVTLAWASGLMVVVRTTAG